MGVSLAALRVGVLRATLRFGASLRSALLTHPPHASRSSFYIFYLVFIHTFALPCLRGCCFILFCIHFQVYTRLNLEYIDFLQPFNPDSQNFTLF
ncbi:MAG: hypothetical protein RML94_08805 [Bacteroidia bacterium]|nr:hypothetical protein [Bacteroidia bacterium]